MGFYDDDYMINSNGFFVPDILVEFIFLLDLILNCFCAYYDSEGTLEFEILKILYNYLNAWLIIDMICLFPMNIFARNESIKYIKY